MAHESTSTEFLLKVKSFAEFIEVANRKNYTVKYAEDVAVYIAFNSLGEPVGCARRARVTEPPDTKLGWIVVS